MKQLIYIIFLASLASCSSSFVAKNDVKKNADLRDVEFENETERAFMGFDLDKVWEREVNIKVKADGKNLDAFVQKAIKLGCKEVSRNQGFADGEMFVCVKVLGDYPTTLKKIRELSDVVYAEPNYKVTFADGWTPPSASAQILKPFNLEDGNLEKDPVGDEAEYALAITEALRAYSELGYGEHNVWAGIVDSGTDANHEDLKYPNGDKVVKILRDATKGAIVDVPSGNSDYETDRGGHGTHCTGTICAVGNNNKGIAGVAWKNVYFASYKGIFNGGGSLTAIYGSLRNLVDTVRQKVTKEQQATIPVNFSLGSSVANNMELESINYAMSRGVLMVAANGNEGQYLTSYPAGYPGVLAVAATGGDDKVTGFSTAGSWLNVAAPGLHIISLQHLNRTGYVHMTGTSMATPFVTGLVAYLLSFDPTLTPMQITAILEKTADKVDAKNRDPLAKYDENGFSCKYGYGRVNVYQAAKMVVEGRAPKKGDVYVETVLNISFPYSGKPVYVYDKATGVLVSMSLPYGYPSRSEIRGLKAGKYNVVFNGRVKEVEIGNDKNVKLQF